MGPGGGHDIEDVGTEDQVSFRGHQVSGLRTRSRRGPPGSVPLPLGEVFRVVGGDSVEQQDDSGLNLTVELCHI